MWIFHRLAYCLAKFYIICSLFPHLKNLSKGLEPHLLKLPHNYPLRDAKETRLSYSEQCLLLGELIRFLLHAVVTGGKGMTGPIAYGKLSKNYWKQDVSDKDTCLTVYSNWGLTNHHHKEKPFALKVSKITDNKSTGFRLLSFRK